MAAQFLCGHSFCHAQDGKLYAGVSSYGQWTATELISIYKTPAYNAWGLSSGYGVLIGRVLSPKWSVELQYHRSQLINTYSIFKLDPSMSRADIKKNGKVIDIYWKTNDMAIQGIQTVFSKNTHSVMVVYAVHLFSGQLDIDNFPKQIKSNDTLTQLVYFSTPSQQGVLHYDIQQRYTKELGLAVGLGAAYKKDISNNLSINATLKWISGIVPVVASHMDYVIKDNKGSPVSRGEYSATSYNTGLRLGISLGYAF